MRILNDIINQIIHGDSLEVLKEIPDNSIDAVVTDPPYGLSEHDERTIREVFSKWLSGEDNYIPNKKGFMGKNWDAFVPPPVLWKEVYRVMKPGAHILVFAGTRTLDLMSMSLRLAGFEIRDTIMWVYGSGFPKGMNIAKGIEKKQGAKKQGVEKRGKGSKGNLFLLNQKYQDYELTPDAKRWEGWGTSLKPSYEPIILAKKPIEEGNVVSNVLKWGTGGINIDRCRVKYDMSRETRARYKNTLIRKPKFFKGKTMTGNTVLFKLDLGRFPANLIFECVCDKVIEGKEVGHQTKGSDNRKNPNSFFGTGLGGERNENNSYRDKTIIHTNPECPCRLIDQQSGVSKSIRSYRGVASKRYSAGIEWERAGIETNTIRGYNDEGGASRFFKQIKLEEEDYLPFFYCSKASKKERNQGLVKQQNIHPTVKPIRLCEYLATLITPPDGIVLDPFAGSGSTLIACKRLGIKYIGIELNEEYIDIAKRRLEAVKVEMGDNSNEDMEELEQEAGKFGQDNREADNKDNSNRGLQQLDLFRK
jgi:site-specific DNA-methyltransferase (adenine-specific)